MIKWIVLALAAYALYKFFINDLRKKKQEKAVDQEEKVKAGEMVKDPVCGMYLSVDSGITVREGEKVHRFCSYECREKFLELKRGKEPASIE